MENYQQQKCKIWDFMDGAFVDSNFQVKFTKTKEINYLRDGSILRIDQVGDDSIRPEILTNFDQIQLLQKKGEQGKNQKKVGKWIVIWDGEMLLDVGGLYIEDEKKQGLWRELYKNYWRKAQIYEQGEYFQGQRIGRWKYIYGEQEIGGGSYDMQGQRIGRWIELSNNFSEINYITYSGQYNNNGKKVGRWDIYYENVGKKEQIGGGQYDIHEKDGSSVKIGNWIDWSDTFKHDNLITYVGEYNKQGKKIGRWNIYYENDGNSLQRGGGYFDILEDGNSVKIGNWIELIDNYNNELLVTYSGIYNKEGQKVGRWDIYFEHDKYYGGGLYEIQEQNKRSVKVGKWIEQSDGFHIYKQITYIGVYNKNGQKIGKWDTNYSWDEMNKQIGGGSYAIFQEGGNSVKVGKWIELSEEYQLQSQVTYIGEYDKKGEKVGKWDVYYGKNKQNGGGQFEIQNDQGSSVKIGNWIELCDTFYYSRQITFTGEYNTNGQKFGRWDTYYDEILMYKHSFIIQYPFNSGGGSYNIDKGISNSIKIGKWIELWNEFYQYFLFQWASNCQVTYVGEYSQDGQKIGCWDIYFNFGSQNEITGGGQYENQNGGVSSVKIGKWVELSNKFRDSRQITYKGQYLSGRKIGCWDTYYNQEQIGGGLYEEGNSIKVGKWIELSDTFGDEFDKLLVIYNGEYNKNGQKIGRWDILYRQSSDQFKQIGGGSYMEIEGENSQKTNEWVELSDKFRDSWEITYKGQYLSGRKIGCWDTYYNKEQIGGGLYEEGNSIKVGKWIELSDTNRYRYRELQLINIGEYNKNGKKIGRWDTLCRELHNQFVQIGGGSYDIQVGVSMKNGRWIESSNECNEDKHVTFNGEYKNDKKIGRWDIWRKKFESSKNEQIGGGSYDFGVKIGRWIEMKNPFGDIYGENVYIGEYNKYGKKVGVWVEINLKETKNKSK